MPPQLPIQMSNPSRLLDKACSQQQEFQELSQHINQVQLELALLNQQVELARLEVQVLHKELHLSRLRDQQEQLEELGYHLRACHGAKLRNCSHVTRSH